MSGKRYISMFIKRFLQSCLLCICCQGLAQQDPLSTQYMNSQFSINPAYAGVRNALSMHLVARQQWMGMEGAPVSYLFGMHSPINKTKMSFGGLLSFNQAGPVQSSQFSGAYSYIVRISNKLLLSLGVSASLNNTSIGFTGLDVIDHDDPSFSSDVQNKLSPNFGAGAFLFSRQFYFGCSVPHILNTEIKDSEAGNVISKVERHYYITSGYGFSVGDDMFLKPSCLARIKGGDDLLLDVNTQWLYKELFWIGASYRLNSTMAFLASIRISKSLSICYSYDFPFANTTLQKGSHEISLSFDSFSFYKRNKKREFIRKKKSEKEGIRSIRYF
ncbi:type IX secretion system membrane protein PorP/SprF [Marinilabiliaceae bacterium JC017]|nr:type IX secretion system membrane protein PorP/SprF [Marinilabiliaceae bacterium JC017]